MLELSIMCPEEWRQKVEKKPQRYIFQGHFHQLTWGQLSQYLMKKELHLPEYRLIVKEQGMEAEGYCL